MLKCTKCHSSLQGEVSNSPAMIRCPSCGVFMRVDIFPALFRELPSDASEDTSIVDDEAGCFYHSKKKAVISCSACGRFLCSLCDVEFDGRHLCTSCLETGKKKHKVKNMGDHRILYDSIALALAVIPMIFFWPTILTAPLVLFFVIRYWKAPSSIVSRTKARSIVALLIGSLQIIVWCGIIYAWTRG